ncbi:MAG: sugar ABC transporter ATP-binding protein, partial [Exilispira sp.]|nr:sugar ABC transporter ATP-binding protein [Exilispira sp.]
MNNYILEMKNITKRFPGVVALSDVNFAVKKGEIHCLVGENGAGKSTLMKILSGVYPHGQFEGSIFFEGKQVKFNSTKDSEISGIGIIYQELALVPEMTIYENIMLGHEKTKGISIDIHEMIKTASSLLELVHLKMNPTEKIKELGIGQQQLVEIAKALYRKARLLILDEPTAALNEEDCKNLLNIIRKLKDQGVTSILISHKLKEVLDIGESITVLRDGKTICTLEKGKDEITEQILIKHMVGRSIENIYPERKTKPSKKAILKINNWNAIDLKKDRKILSDINIEVNESEIVGLAGLVGSGRTEFARSIFGNPDGYVISGEIIFKGTSHKFHHPSSAIKAGLAYASEDRKKNGLILIQNVKDNIVLANQKKVATKIGVVIDEEEIISAESYVKSLRIKTPSILQLVNYLSGGNQQKVSIAKWLFASPTLLILDEPTRGIDVGSKYEIYNIMNDLVSQG